LLIISFVCAVSRIKANKKGPQNETLGAENRRILQAEAVKCKLFGVSNLCVGLPSRFRQKNASKSKAGGEFRYQIVTGTETGNVLQSAVLHSFA
jgi:hypothetical protein